MTLAIVPLWLRGPVSSGRLPKPPPRQEAPATGTPRVRLILLDGASLGFIRQRAPRATAEFRPVPRSRRDHRSATLKPAQAVPVWAAAATGKYPPKNGVRPTPSTA
jgi:hypothetical protein